MRHPGEIGVLAHQAPLWQLFSAFATISVRSWGGGSGTIYTMNHELVRRGGSARGEDQSATVLALGGIAGVGLYFLGVPVVVNSGSGGRSPQ